MGGGYFQFFTENRPQKHKKHAILHTSQANGGARAPPAPPPGYATAYSISNHIISGGGQLCCCWSNSKKYHHEFLIRKRRGVNVSKELTAFKLLLKMCQVGPRFSTYFDIIFTGFFNAVYTVRKGTKI